MDSSGKRGEILAAHCNCVAGLGETCSHVASVLWASEAGVRQRELLTVTDRRAYWVQPTYVNDIPYAPVRDINFTGRKGFKAAHENMRAIDPPPPPLPPPTPPQQQQHQQLLKRPSVDAQNAFLAALAGSSVKSAVLAVTRDYYESYIPQAMQDNFPEPLMNL